MKLLSSIEDIPELNNENVHFRNKQEVLDKINKIIKDGHKNLQIVTDFDHTLTRHKMDNGKPVLTSFGMFRECPSIPQHYKDEDNRLSAVYKPIESDPVMSIDEKIKHMVDWYIAAHSLLKGIKFPRNELAERGKLMVECFRAGVRELVDWSEAHSVPVLVFSAGLGDSVRAALDAAGCLLPHVQVISNFLDLDAEDKIVGIQGEVIHTYNKNETALRGTPYYDAVRDRCNVILMGDNIGDAGMAEGMSHCACVLKVGFLGALPERNLQNYLQHFDVVLLEPPSVHAVTAILQRVL